MQHSGIPWEHASVCLHPRRPWKILASVERWPTHEYGPLFFATPVLSIDDNLTPMSFSQDVLVLGRRRYFPVPMDIGVPSVSLWSAPSRRGAVSGVNCIGWPVVHVLPCVLEPSHRTREETLGWDGSSWVPPPGFETVRSPTVRFG